MRCVQFKIKIKIKIKFYFDSKILFLLWLFFIVVFNYVLCPIIRINYRL